jgi:hypothetical protein
LIEAGIITLVVPSYQNHHNKELFEAGEFVEILLNDSSSTDSESSPIASMARYQNSPQIMVNLVETSLEDLADKIVSDLVSICSGDKK